MGGADFPFPLTGRGRPWVAAHANLIRDCCPDVQTESVIRNRVIASDPHGGTVEIFPRPLLATCRWHVVRSGRPEPMAEVEGGSASSNTGDRAGQAQAARTAGQPHGGLARPDRRGSIGQEQTVRP